MRKRLSGPKGKLPRRGRLRARLRKLYLPLSLCLALGTGACASRGHDPVSKKPVAAKKKPVSSTKKELYSACTHLERIDRSHDDVCRNLESGLAYWKSPGDDGKPRLVLKIEKLLAEKGVKLESGMLVEMVKKINGFEVGRNVFPAILGDSRGNYFDNQVFVNHLSLSLGTSRIARSWEVRYILAHEMIHSLDPFNDLGQLKKSNFTKQNKAYLEVTKGIMAILEGFTDYLAVRVMRSSGMEASVSYKEPVCMIKGLISGNGVLKALVKLFFMPFGKRESRKPELNASVKKVMTQAWKLDSKCKLKPYEIADGAAFLLMVQEDPNSKHRAGN